MNIWLIILTLCFGTAFLLFLFYIFLIWNFGQWKKRGIAEAKSYPFLGSFPSGMTQKRHMIYDVDDIYRKFKSANRFVGVFQCRIPQLLILDPELVKQIYVHDFKAFHDNELSDLIDEKSDSIMANNPFSIKGDKWKKRRVEIIPGLSPNRIKTAYPVTLDVCQRLTQYIKNKMKNSGREGLDTYQLLLCYTSEVVSDCVLGIKADSLNDEPSPILNMIKELSRVSPSVVLYQIAAILFPSFRYFFKINIFPEKARIFFCNLLSQAIEIRRQQQSKGDGDRADFLNYVLQLQDKKNLPNNIMTSHVMTFLTDGFLTTAHAVAHCLLGLARNPEAQEKLLQEILDNLDSDGHLTFEKLSELPYLDACFHESLRLLPPILFITKLCTERHEFVNKNGHRLKLKKGDIVILPHYSLAHDENYYEDPECFKPERFLPENGGVKKYREEGKFLAFGNGPRICLGMRFALTQGKAAIAEIVRNFNVKLNPKTRSDNTLEKREFLARLDGGVWLDFETRN